MTKPQKIDGGKRKSYIVGEFNDTGINTVDVDMVSKDWSHLWSLSQYGAKFKLLRNGRKNYIKTEISSQQADELIEKLGLGAEKAYPFRKALNWKQND